MKALIIEDELPAADQLTRMLAKAVPGMEVLHVCKSIQDSVKWFSNNDMPDIVFMDIELADGKSFDIFKQVEITAPVIFITAYDAYAIKAIKLNALDYLLKPINDEELAQALEKVKNHRVNAPAGQSMQELQRLVSGMIDKAKPRKLGVSTVEGTFFIEIDGIIRLEAESNYTTIFTTGKQKLMTSRTLKEYEEMLADCGFYRVHNSHLINTAHIGKYIKGDGGTLVLTNGDSIEVSRQKKRGLMDLLGL